MQIGAMTLTALAGATLAVQVGLNATMRDHAGSPMAAALVNFAVGTVFLFIAVLFGRSSLGAIAGVTAAPWWAWGAGILGGLYIAASAAFGPMIGGATFLALIVAGQMVAALALDHYGVLGFPVRPLDAGRAAGALLVVAGMFLLARQ
jgi:transporter family-2 protein